MAKTNPVLLALKPRFADCIFSGEKTVELRRGNANFQPGQRVLIYASSPTMAIQGEFVVVDVHHEQPGQLWPSVQDKACVSADEFIAYYTGAKAASAIVVGQPRRWPRPVPLAELRETIARFAAPQSYRYLSHEQAADLWQAAHGGASDQRLAVA